MLHVKYRYTVSKTKNLKALVRAMYKTDKLSKKYKAIIGIVKYKYHRQ